MARRTSTAAAEADFLGLVALGSLVGNLSQAFERGRLEDDRRRLHAYLRDLRNAYAHLEQRHRLAAEQFEILRRTNEELWSKIRELERVADELRRHNVQIEREYVDARERAERRETTPRSGGAK
jgi:predicted RNase H-like nuclease (RuvC/YqgF family)